MDTETLERVSVPQHTAQQDTCHLSSKCELFHHLHSNMNTYSVQPVLRDHVKPSLLHSLVLPAVVPCSPLVDVVGH